MASPPLLLSSPPPLRVESWYGRNSGLDQLFCPDCVITISQSGGMENCRVYWESDKKMYHMDLQWDGEKLSGTAITIFHQEVEIFSGLTVTIFKSPHPLRWPAWIGELTPMPEMNGSQGNTGVFIAQQDPAPPYEPADGKGTSTAA